MINVILNSPLLFLLHAHVYHMGFLKDCETDLSKILVSPLGNLKETGVPACDGSSVSCKKMSKQRKNVLVTPT